RLHRHLHRLHRLGRALFHAGPRAHVLRLHAFQHERRRSFFRRDGSGPLELGQGLGSRQAPAAARPHPRPGRHGPAHPHHARQPPRRAAPPLRGDGESPWPERDARHFKVPGPGAPKPFPDTLGDLLPYSVSGSIIVSLVLSLPTVGPLLLRALVAQDMFLAGTIVLLLGVMTVIGTFLSAL